MTSAQLHHSVQAGMRNIVTEMNSTVTTPIPDLCQTSESLMSSFNYSLPSSLKSVLWGRPDEHIPPPQTTFSSASSFDQPHSLVSLRPWYSSLSDQPPCGKEDGFSKNLCYDSGGRLFYTDDRQHEESSPNESLRVLRNRQSPPMVSQHTSGTTGNEMVPAADIPKLLDDSDSPSDFSLQNRSENEVLETGLETTTQVIRPVNEQRLLTDPTYGLDEAKVPYLKQLFCAKALFSGTSRSQSEYPNFTSYEESEQKKPWAYSQYTDAIVPQTEPNRTRTNHVSLDTSARLFQASMIDTQSGEPNSRPPVHPQVSTATTTITPTETLGRPHLGVYCPPVHGTSQCMNRPPRSYEPRPYSGAPRPNYHPPPNPFIPTPNQQPTYHPAFSNLRHFGPSGFPHHGHGSFGYGLDGTRRKNATRESTTTLKVWLQEHIKNPYPTKGEKIMLAIITKMTLTQVSTWFANARRRLKKENKMTWPPKTNTTASRQSPNGSRYPSSNTGSSEHHKRHDEDSNPDGSKELQGDNEDEDDEDAVEGSDVDDVMEDDEEDGLEEDRAGVSRPVENNFTGQVDLNKSNTFCYSSPSDKAFSRLTEASLRTTPPGLAVNNQYFGFNMQPQPHFRPNETLRDTGRTCVQLTASNMGCIPLKTNAPSSLPLSLTQHDGSLQPSPPKDRFEMYNNVSSVFSHRPTEYMSSNLAYTSPFNPLNTNRPSLFPSALSNEFDPLTNSRQPPCSFTQFDQSHSAAETYSHPSSFKHFPNTDPPITDIDVHHTRLPPKHSNTTDSVLYVPSLLNPF